MSRSWRSIVWSFYLIEHQQKQRTNASSSSPAEARVCFLLCDRGSGREELESSINKRNGEWNAPREQRALLVRVCRTLLPLAVILFPGTNKGKAVPRAPCNYFAASYGIPSARESRRFFGSSSVLVKLSCSVYSCSRIVFDEFPRRESRLAWNLYIFIYMVTDHSYEIIFQFIWSLTTVIEVYFHFFDHWPLV